MGDSYQCTLCYEYWHGWPRLFDDHGREFCSKACLKAFKRRERNMPSVDFSLPSGDLLLELEPLAPPAPVIDNKGCGAPVSGKEDCDG